MRAETIARRLPKTWEERKGPRPADPFPLALDASGYFLMSSADRQEGGYRHDFLLKDFLGMIDL